MNIGEWPPALFIIAGLLAGAANYYFFKNPSEHEYGLRSKMPQRRRWMVKVLPGFYVLVSAGMVVYGVVRLLV